MRCCQSDPPHDKLVSGKPGAVQYVFHNVHEMSPFDPYGLFQLGNLAITDA